jgi:hypothetical protein
MLNKKTEIIDLGEKIHEIIYRVIVQINDPRKIDKRILKDFLGKGHTEKVKIIKGKQVCEGELLNLYPYSMGIKPLDKNFKLKRNDTILVQLKHPTYDQHFVMQAVVIKVFSSWVNAECQDPRYDKRYNFRLQSEIDFFVIPHTFYDLIKRGGVHIAREILHQVADKGGIVHSYAENIFSRSNSESDILKDVSKGQQHLHPEYKSLLTNTPLRGNLKDISQGGICILLNDKLYDKKNLLLARFATPPIENINPQLNCDPLFFNLLGAVRGFSTIGSRYGLHIQFLKRLEDDILDDTLSKLETYYKRTGKPL